MILLKKEKKLHVGNVSDELLPNVVVSKDKLSLKQKLESWLETLLCFSFIIALFYVIFWPAIVDGVSMESTFSNKDRLFISRLYVHFLPLKQGDIVVFKLDGKDTVKRVIALPGDHIIIKNGQVMVNGELIVEKYVLGFTYHDVDIILDKNKFFLMGDNREHSMDSRSFGPVDKSKLVGKVLFKLFPGFGMY